MEKAVHRAVLQSAKAREDFAHSAENRRRGPERELTFAEREGGGGFRQKRARSTGPLVDAHRDRYAAAVTIQAAVTAKAARALVALLLGLHDVVRQGAGNDYGEWHPVGFGGDGFGNGPALDAVVALGVRIAADAGAARRRPLNQHHEDDDEAEDEARGELKNKVVDAACAQSGEGGGARTIPGSRGCGFCCARTCASICAFCAALCAFCACPMRSSSSCAVTGGSGTGEGLPGASGRRRRASEARAQVLRPGTDAKARSTVALAIASACRRV